MKTRLKIIQLFFAIWSMVILSRLFYWQVVKADELKSQAQFQQSDRTIIQANRGKILFSDLQPIVDNSEKYALIIEPEKINDQAELVKNTLISSTGTNSAALNLDYAFKNKLKWATIGKQLSKETKDKLQDLKLSGFHFQTNNSRMHPEGSSSAYITGFVGKNEIDQPVGYFGLEGYYNRSLSGSPGYAIGEKDAFGMPITIGLQADIPPTSGKDLITSIDRSVQYIAYSKLKEGVEKFAADSGTVTILDTDSSQVLAMVSFPGYDPDKYELFSSKIYKNPIVSVSYEPGSTFKTLVMAAGLDAGVVNEKSVCTTCSGPLVISGETVRNYDDKYYENSTVEDILLHSDNVGMVYIARLLGKEKLLNYLSGFGVGKLTGIDQQEESIIELRDPENWYEIDWSTAAFGQGIAVTPLQLTAAVNCLASGGMCHQPRIAQEVIDNGQITNFERTKSWRAISQQSADRITAVMTRAVDNGQVKIHKPAGYSVAGKTGTAQVAIEGHYDKDRTIASFVGFGPVPKPKFTMLVTVDNPKTSPWGSTTAAPIWFSIAREIFRYYKLPPRP